MRIEINNLNYIKKIKIIHLSAFCQTPLKLNLNIIKTSLMAYLKSFVKIFIEGELLLFSDYAKIQSSQSCKKYTTENKSISFKSIYFKKKLRFRFVDFFGIENYLDQIREFVEWPLRKFKQFIEIGLDAVSTIYLHGPEKSGKTFLPFVIAGEYNIPIFYINAFLLKKIVNDESNKKIFKIFCSAYKNAPSIVFIDEIDKFFQSDEKTQKVHQQEILDQIRNSIKFINKKADRKIFFFGASTHLQSAHEISTDSLLFNNEIVLKNPSLTQRLYILQKCSKKLNFSKDITLDEIAAKTSGYSYGNLYEMMLIGINLAVSRAMFKLYKGIYRINTIEFNKYLSIKKSDVEQSYFKKKIDSSNVPKKILTEITWKNIGGLDKIRQIMSKYVIEPIKHYSSDNFKFKIKGFGFLLYGPPGCGKTLIAQAVANECGATFIGVKGPEIFDKFLGESEKSIRSIFSKARLFAPTIIFFDEIDSIASKRSNDENNSQNGANERVLNQLLTEMDGFEFNNSVYIIAATNRPDIIDNALIRPGRLDKCLFVPLPNKIERTRILKTLLKKYDVLPYLSLPFFYCNLSCGFSGADLMGLIREGFLDSEEKKISYLRIYSGTQQIRLNYVLLIGSKNIMNGFKKINKNMSVIL